MDELLFSRGNNKRVVVATSNILVHDAEGSESLKNDFIMKKCLKVFSIESIFDLQKCWESMSTSMANAYERNDQNLHPSKLKKG